MSVHTVAVLAPELRGRHLGRTGQLLVAAGGAGVAALVWAVTPARGGTGLVITAAIAATAAVTMASWLREGRRRAVSRLFTTGLVAAFMAAVIPLLLVGGYTVYRGAAHLSGRLFTHSMAGVPPTAVGGGIYHAIVGTVEMVALSCLLSVPVGLLAAVYLTEYGRGALAGAIRFFVEVMTGIPSIVAGLFIYAFFVLGLHRGYSGFAGALALAVLQLPIVVRSSEEMIRLVPDALREASYALGVSHWRTILRVVLPTASAGITTGVMLAVARVAGETAPLLLTSFDNAFINTDPFNGPQAALSVFVYNSAQQAYPAAVDRAWAAALTLIALVIALYVAARLLTHRGALTRR